MAGELDYAVPSGTRPSTSPGSPPLPASGFVIEVRGLGGG